MIAIFQLLFVMIIVHAALDFPLQGDTVAINKNPHANTELQKHVPWIYWLLSHALMHSGGVLLVTGSFYLAFCELVAHFMIDLGKCNGKYSIHMDQALHILCKIIWIILLIVGVG